MNSLRGICIIMLSMSCNMIAGHRNAYSTDLKRVHTCTIDESLIVHSQFPFSMALSADSLLACIVDYKQLVYYNIDSGNVVKSVHIDSFMREHGFNITQYVKDNCLNVYEGRRYITDMKEIESLGIPLYKVLKILPPLTASDSINLLIDILTPYETKFVYEGKDDTAVWLSYSTMIASINLQNRAINEIIPVNTSLIEKNNDSDTALRMYTDPEFGSLYFNHKFYTRVGPDLTHYRQVPEVGIFSLGNRQAVRLGTYMYPDAYRTLGKSNVIWQHFQVAENNRIYANSLYDLYTIDEPGHEKEIISFKKLLDAGKREYINNFYKLRNGDFIIQTKATDSGKHYYNFRFYNTRTKQLSDSKLRMTTDSISPNVIFKDNRIIFFSKDEAHFYIETYEMAGA